MVNPVNQSCMRDMKDYRDAIASRRTVYTGTDTLLAFFSGALLASCIWMAVIGLSGGL